MEIEKLLPEIEGASARQIWYAEQLRQKYITENEDRFNDIYETVMLENDKRDLEYNDDYLSSFDFDFNNAEKAVLFGINAGAIISTLKKYVL